MITIVGDAGIGKSRLAQEVIARRRRRGRRRPRPLPRPTATASPSGRCARWPARPPRSASTTGPRKAAPSWRRWSATRTSPTALAAAIGLSTGRLPAARDLLGGAQVLRDARRRRPAGRARRRHPLGRVGVPRPARARARHGRGRADPAALHVAPRPAREAPRLGRAARRDAPRAAPADRRCRGARRSRSTCSARPGCRPTSWRASSTAAEGNPLYVEQMLSMLVDSGALRQEDGSWVRAESYGEIAIPPTIKALIEARLGQLRREERAAIEPASVIGLQFAAPAVASLAPEAVRPAIEAICSALTRKQLVHAVASMDSDSLYRFHHHLVRDTVYGGLLKRARATLHVDFVRWADQVNAERGRGARVRGDPRLPPRAGAPLPGRARAARREGPRDRRDAARRLASAGRRAFARGDVHAAGNLLRRAVALLPQEDAAAPAAASRARRGAAGARPVRRSADARRRSARERREAAPTTRVEGVGAAGPDARAPAQRRVGQLERRRRWS